MMKRGCVLGVMLLSGVSCSTTPTPQHELNDQILKVRKGFEGSLTNRACLEYDGKKCKKDNITVYSLEDQKFRDTVNRLDFICNIGGKRFKVCIDKPGFCRKSSVCAWWDLAKLFCEPAWEYIPVSDFQFLIDSRARCFNKNKYSFDME